MQLLDIWDRYSSQVLLNLFWHVTLFTVEFALLIRVVRAFRSGQELLKGHNYMNFGLIGDMFLCAFIIYNIQATEMDVHDLILWFTLLLNQ